MRKSIQIFPAFTFIFFGFLFFHLARQMLQIRSDGWYVGQVNLYGDLVFHLGLINRFLETNSLTISSPIFASTKPNYPIFADLITSKIAQISSIDFALFITTFTAGIVLIFTSRLFINKFTKSEGTVFLTLLLFLVNGGFGFYYFFSDFLKSAQLPLQFLSNLPGEYTDIKESGYWFINTTLAYFLPQRGFLIAFPMTLVVLLLLFKGHKKVKLIPFAQAGLITGALPIVQAHSLFVIFLLSLFFAPASILTAKKKSKLIQSWATFAVVSAILSFVLFSSISQSSNALKFIRIDPGWTSAENIIWFWLKNLGLFAPLLIWSLIWLYKKYKNLFLLYLPFLFIFFLSNIFIFQPWEFDNSKIMLYWFFASCIVVALFLHENFFSENVNRKILGAIIVIFTILAGSIDIFRTFTPVSSYQIFSNNDLEIASLTKNLTDKDAIFVTAPVHNHPIPALSGRTTLLGFHGWAWTHGLPYQERAQDIRTIYLGGEEAEKLISKYKIKYVTIGPHEKTFFSINESYFKKYPQIHLDENWQIYDVGTIWSDGNRQN
ncbi:MAG: hypothetical protein NUV69_02550 [Candidatus Curtissbacteria bacterium]|nr:hypothetical protein [Candidatus Curtissbacteria bacterium]